MKKSTKTLVRQKIAIILVVLMSINTLGAVVGDNDGSAFITKAEFDSLKNDFQAQIDQYNTSIDSKIDGAIASYLSGISLSKIQQEKCVSYVKDGVLSVIGSENMPWGEGAINFHGFYIMSRENAGYTWYDSSYSLIGSWVLETEEENWDDILAFRETAIKNVDWTNGHAEWGGYNETKYKMAMRGRTTAETGFPSTLINPDSGIYFKLSPYNGLEYFSSTLNNPQDWWKNFNLHHEWGWGYQADGEIRANGWYWQRQHFFPERKIVHASNSIVISTKVDNPKYDFVNYDGFYDFQNDANSSAVGGVQLNNHSYEATYHDKIFKNAYVWGTMLNRRKDSEPTASALHGFGFDSRMVPGSSTKPSGYPLEKVPYPATFDLTDNYNTSADWRKMNPYIGYTYWYTKNWNQLWTSAFDRELAEMKDRDASLNTIQDSNGDEHLALTAGLPICPVDKECKLILPLSFKNESTSNKDHYVWIKSSSFSNSLNPQDDTDCITQFAKVERNGVVDNTLVDLTLRAIKVPAGDTVTITTNEMENNSYIFVKWSLTDNSCAGGGTFMPPEYVNIETAS